MKREASYMKKQKTNKIVMVEAPMKEGDKI